MGILATTTPCGIPTVKKGSGHLLIHTPRLETPRQGRPCYFLASRGKLDKPRNHGQLVVCIKDLPANTYAAKIYI
jgi:hypothetical protein